MIVELKKTDYDEIVEYANQELPNESCGLIAGRIEAGKKIVEKIYLLENLDKSPEHFSMAPQEQFAAIKDARANGWQLLGNFHSHPSSPSRPSEEDKRLAYDSSASYLILSLQDNANPVLKSFHIEKQTEVTIEDVILVD